MNQSYIVSYFVTEWDHHETLKSFTTKAELHAFLVALHQKRTVLNQRHTEFARVFPINASYPTDYDAFHTTANDSTRKRYGMGDGYIVSRKKKKKVITKWYPNGNDFDWQLEEWKQKGYTDIRVLNVDESIGAAHYVSSEIEQTWGKKEPLFA